MNNIFSYSFEEYTERVKSFHGGLAPGVLIGGFMVDLAVRSLPTGKLYDVICETAKCLPDAVQLLTPCTIGNQWLKIVDVGRYALAFYDKQTGAGVRVYLDYRRLDPWPIIREWFLKLKPKREQDTARLIREIREAGPAVCGIDAIMVSLESLAKPRGRVISICPSCHEAYPPGRDAICPACGGGVLPYISGVADYPCNIERIAAAQTG